MVQEFQPVWLNLFYGFFQPHTTLHVAPHGVNVSFR